MQKLTEVHLQRDCSIATELLHYLTKGKLPHDFFSEEGWVRVNVDGSVRMGGCQVSCGRVFRNEDGLWMEGFVSNLERNVSKLWIETDSAMSLDLISKPLLVTHHYTPLLRKVQQFQQLRITQTYREGNCVADWLARLRHTLPMGFHLLDQPPKFIIYCGQVFLGILFLGKVRL
ncbi:putative ribonuclease H protein [Glycine soja]